MSEKNTTFKLAVVGNPSSVLLYKALGCETYGVTTPESAREQVETCFRAVQDEVSQMAKYAVVFVDEGYYQSFPEDLVEKFTKKALPAIIPVPSPGSDADGFATKRLRKIVERAVGSDILG